MSKNHETDLQESVQAAKTTETVESSKEAGAHTAPVDVDSLRRQTQAMKKRMLLVIGCILGALVLLFGVITLISYLTADDANEIPEYDYTFYPVYEGDILEYAPYVAKNRALNYCDNPYGYGLTQAVTDENRATFDARVLFLEAYIKTVIAGDSEAYNALFSEQYYKNHDPMQPFSPQMIYNIYANYDMTEKDDNGELLYTYKLSYMILRNDGTFRRDIGSESTRLQYITLRESAEGTILVDRIVTLHKTEK